MNKAAFLDILNHVSSISEQEVIELEKLALNFPYCQSAHLLLAKAAYDRGSMLSNQRLRRAAACAANRQLLKKLIYTSGMDLVLEPLSTDGEPQAEALPLLEPIEAEPLELESYPAETADTPAPAATPVAEALPIQHPDVLAPIETEALELESQLTEAATASAPEAELPEPELQGQAMLMEETPQATPLSPQEPLAAQVEALTEGYDIPDLLEETDLQALMQAPPEAAQQVTETPESLPAPAPAARAQPDQTEAAEDHDDLFAVMMAGPSVALSATFKPEEAAEQAPLLLQEQHAAEEKPAALTEGYDIPDLLEEADIQALTPAPEPVAAEQPAAIPAVASAVAALTGETEELDDLFAVDSLAAYHDPVMAFVNALEAGEPTGAAEIVAMETAIPAEEAPQPEVPETALPAAEAALTETGLAGSASANPEPQAETPSSPQELEQPAAAAASTAENDETLTRFDHYLFTPEKEEEPISAPSTGTAYQEEIIYKVYDANELGYWMDSSRLGETLLRKNELASAQPYFFRPELLLEYSRHHEIGTYQPPEPSVLTRQLDIIDQFLKLNPKIKSMANLKIKPDSQEDLSLKSTKIRKGLASETFANILVQQGKIKKAIKIYEHLMLKLPEKKDYFASQIEKLQNISQ